MAAPRVLGTGFVPGSHADRQAKRLRRKFRSFDADMKAAMAALDARPCAPPDRSIPGYHDQVWKRRVACSESPGGKSGGYRVVYAVLPQGLVVLDVYHKSDREDVDHARLLEALAEACRSAMQDATAAAPVPADADDE